MDRKMIEAGVNMVSLALEGLAPAEERASVRRMMKGLTSELDKLLDAIEAAKSESSIIDTLAADSERARNNLAATMALVLLDGASEQRILEEIGKYRVHQAVLDQHLIHTLLMLPRVAAPQPARGDVH